MVETVTIGLDLQGGDHPPKSLLEGIIESLRGKIRLALFGTPEILKHYADIDMQSVDVEMIPVEEVIEQDEDPLVAIRQKKESSTVVAMRLLKEGRIDAHLSVGNTGALLAAATTLLPRFKNISRPALLALIPTAKKTTALLDVGAGTSAKPEHLLQFAKMGIAYQQALGILNPTVGLLNIGQEPLKGRKEHKEAYKKLKRSLKNQFIGNIEGTTFFQGVSDVVVTDGFTGNIFLKTAEGLSAWISKKIDIEIEHQSSALLCGVQHIVVKCHSHSSAQSIAQSLDDIKKLIHKDFISLLNKN